MDNFIALFTGNLTLFAVIIAVIFIIITSVLLIRRFTARKETKSPQMAVKSVENSAERQVRSDTEAKPAEPKGLDSFASLGELASKIGAKYLLFFNQFGVPIESYNFSEEYRVSALLAEFIPVMRRLNPDFNLTFFDDRQKIILLSVGKVGEIETFALAVSDSGMMAKVEEIRDLLRTYLLESLGRCR